MKTHDPQRRLGYVQDLPCVQYARSQAQRLLAAGAWATHEWAQQ